MPSSNKLPAKCTECYKSTVSCLHRKCLFCNEIEFEELILCDLNRSVQDTTDFQCHAFQPILKLVDPSIPNGSEYDTSPTKEIQKISLVERLKSDKIKYERALALQRLGRDPDGIYVQLKYHFAWSISHRIAAFSPAEEFFGFIYDSLFRCSDLVDGFVKLLSLAPDHIHVYVESDGDLSAEEIAHRIKRFSNDAILKEFPHLGDTFNGGAKIWDEAYFVETIGYQQ